MLINRVTNKKVFCNVKVGNELNQIRDEKVGCLNLAYWYTSIKCWHFYYYITHDYLTFKFIFNDIQCLRNLNNVTSKGGCTLEHFRINIEIQQEKQLDWN